MRADGRSPGKLYAVVGVRVGDRSWNAGLRNRKAGVHFVLAETRNVFVVCLQHRRNLMSGAVAKPDPNDLGRKSEKETALMKF